MKPFIQQLDELMQKDRQKFILSATKIGQDLVIQITPDAKGTGKVIDITIPSEDISAENIDEQVMNEVVNMMQQPAKVEMASSVTETETEEEESEQEDSTEKEHSGGTKKPAAKKAPAKRGVKKEDTAETGKTEEEIIENIEAPAAVEETPDPIVVVEEKKKAEPTQDVSAPVLTFKEAKDKGTQLFADRDYKGSLEMYNYCLTLKPDDEVVQGLAKKSNQWVEAIARLKK